MAASTSIAYGIDLGTTNSSIATLLGNDVHVVRNKESQETTPSVVRLQWLSGRIEALDVGRKARQHLVIDHHCVVQRAKDFMGVAGSAFPVPGSPAGETAVQVAARILRELTGSVQRSPGLPAPRSAVITVPAIFNQAARDDTRQAGLLAGFEHVELYPEPAAAALAFGHQLEPAGAETWLVYDLGGGTFDCALVRAEDGVFTVVDTGGDRRLGGGNLDEAIVRRLLIPQLPSKLRDELARLGDRLSASKAWWQLLFEAEAAKIQVDIDDRADIVTTLADQDVHLQLAREDVEALQVELFGRTIGLCLSLITRNGFTAQQVQRLLLVGGPTRSAFLRRMIEKGARRANGSTIEGLGIALDAGVDPMTAVARGAALYAASRRFVAQGDPLPVGNEAAARVEFFGSQRVLADDADLLVTGRVTPASGSADGWAVVLERMDGDVVGWHSEPVTLVSNGGFTRRVPLHQGRNDFGVRVLDAQRAPVAVDAGARFEVFRGIVAGEPILELGLGVADMHGDTVWFLRKGASLPAGPVSMTFETQVALTPEGSEAVIIPIVEGMNSRAFLNATVLERRITFGDVKRAFAAQTLLELTMSVSHDREVALTVDFVGTGIKVAPAPVSLIPDPKDLRHKLDVARTNHALFRQVRQHTKAIDRVVAKIDDEMLLPECESLLAEGSSAHPLPWDRARALVLEVLAEQEPHKAEVDRLLQWDAQSGQWRDNVERAKRIVDEEPRPADWRAQFDALCRRFETAAAARDDVQAPAIAMVEIPELFERLESLRVRVGSGGDDDGGTGGRGRTAVGVVAGNVKRA